MKTIFQVKFYGTIYFWADNILTANAYKDKVPGSIVVKVRRKKGNEYK